MEKLLKMMTYYWYNYLAITLSRCVTEPKLGSDVLAIKTPSHPAWSMLGILWALGWEGVVSGFFPSVSEVPLSGRCTLELGEASRCSFRVTVSLVGMTGIFTCSVLHNPVWSDLLGRTCLLLTLESKPEQPDPFFKILFLCSYKRPFFFITTKRASIINWP